MGYSLNPGILTGRLPRYQSFKLVYLKRATRKVTRLRTGTPVYLATVLEYLAAEILELDGRPVLSPAIRGRGYGHYYYGCRYEGRYDRYRGYRRRSGTVNTEKAITAS
ncbi:hypothetical protein QBC39DRAFT_329600 [Podospora conica]|nr:hypothetical protein QBC39DRAFT_329600 [Schizothecium conicum]